MKQCKPTDSSDQANPKEDLGVVKLYEAYKAMEIVVFPDQLNIDQAGWRGCVRCKHSPDSSCLLLEDCRCVVYPTAIYHHTKFE